MNALVQSAGQANALALRDDELLPVLQSSLYPGAKPESIKLVLGYCRAAQLDPMQKPVHIVPMLVKTGKKNDRGYDEKEWRDVIMPGVGLYRTQAARTGLLAGISEPEFGPTVSVAGVDVPEWCRVTVYRLVGGEPRPFTALEYWEENYATKGRDSAAPNEMWSRRRRGQIAKCAEAQALRKAFPEVGSMPTADEVEGREEFVADGVTVQAAATPAPAPAFEVKRKTKPAANAEDAQEKKPSPAPAPASDSQAGGEDLVGLGEVAYLRNKANALGLDLASVLESLGGLVLEKLTKADFAVVKTKLMEAGQ